MLRGLLLGDAAIAPLPAHSTMKIASMGKKQRDGFGGTADSRQEPILQLAHKTLQSDTRRVPGLPRRFTQKPVNIMAF
jgi:hypothetical protein